MNILEAVIYFALGLTLGHLGCKYLYCLMTEEYELQEYEEVGERTDYKITEVAPNMVYFWVQQGYDVYFDSLRGFILDKGDYEIVLMDVEEVCEYIHSNAEEVVNTLIDIISVKGAKDNED